MFCESCARRFLRNSWLAGAGIPQLGDGTGVTMSSRQWFDYRHHSMLFDLCDEPLIHD